MQQLPQSPSVAVCLVRCGLLATAIFAGTLIGCSNSVSSGGTGGGGTPSVQVAVTGSSAVRVGSTAQYAAAVTGTANTSVTWEINGLVGGSAATGTISNSGLYSAPATLPANATLTVTAVSQVSASASGTESVALQNPVPILTSATALQVGSSLSYAVDVIGTSFVQGATINYGSTAQSTTFVSSTELQATITVPSGTTSIGLSVTNPNPGSSSSSTATVSITFFTTTATTAARLLDQATFGPTTAAITQVQQMGVSAWIQNQFSQPTTTLAAIPTNPLPTLCFSSNTAYSCAESEWWQAVITGPDQLRQRVAFALSEMFVISTQTVPGQTIPAYHNMLANDAFTNFATIMHDVSVSPGMGDYLNMLNSAKPATGQIANENYARENMQLFTIGLDLLNQDGSLQLDGSGNPIPAYTQAQVQAFARAYTGWTYGNAAGTTLTKFPNSTADWVDPMQPVDSAHDTTSKTLLNSTVLPAGQTTTQDLAGALGNLFNHPNAGPFVCKQLIQHLVTSTPSPAYVSRVAAVFANNGSGVRGDMQAVITAILTDQEARAGDTNASFDGGHFREPILFITAMMRAFNFSNTSTTGSWVSLSTYSNNLNERPYRANSVFNFFPPDYVIPATTINAPEFGIENTATATLQESLADSIVNNKISAFTVDLSNTSSWGVLAANPTNLVTALNTLLMHSQMPSAMQTAIVNTITPLTSNAQRVRIAIFLIVTSPQYKIIH
ncbi:Uncharacterized conserved protein, DUF1800 family [Bryocella elongata]|uniref:Uncharacterized conserved protein, DUF1800 family n=1 Tax=Bryocella elongata TaxID=863522 RepID=A0A1H5TNT3_9BACT|nr:DUF1800 domain-containing protein [Bryocella elongata]SEF64409.1 Uncharacterized conserved protein, DUF1800 family [Bryocella elongata]